MKVELIGHYGSDLTHAQSAWTSTIRDLDQEKLSRVDKLLKFLAENGHHTPFEKSFFHFLVEADTASHIHTLKHRIGVSVNGESARYRTLDARHYVPDDWPQDMKNLLNLHSKQGEDYYKLALDVLQEFGFSKKRAKESARYFLGYNNLLYLDVSFNFRSLMHFVALRAKEDAQKEIYDIAEEMLRLVRNTKDFEHSLAGFGYIWT